MSNSTPDGSRTWDRVQALFHEALALGPDAGAALLSKLAAEDPAIAGEVRSLLAAHERSGEFLEESPVARFIRSISPGDKLGPYRIAEEIGRGGMGVVYRAMRDDESFTKEVAIKLIDPGLRSDEILKRFRAERQIHAMLDHPHIARLIDGGAAPDGSPYLVMEFVDGVPMLEFCNRGRLGVDERLAIFLMACDTVQFAHQRLVVHRDLKSDNILVTVDGSPHLLDFGIAKLLSADGTASDATRTAPMHRRLTPDYASPEQIRGEPATVAGDVYSLGVILYELLCGSRPFRFTTGSPEEVLWTVMHQEPPPPSVVVARAAASDAALHSRDTTRQLLRRLAGDLDFIVLKALEKDSSQRYGSADQLAQDVRRHLEGLPVRARAQTTRYRLSRFVRRHRATVITTAVIAVSLLVGLAGTIWQAGVAGRERDRATRRFDDVRALAHAVVFDLHDAIATLPGSTKARELLVQHALRYLDRLSREVKGDVALQHDLALAYAKVGDVQGRPMFPNLGRSADALVSYDHAMRLLREASQAHAESTSIIHDLIVVSQRRTDLLEVMGRHGEAMREAVSARDRIASELARRPDDPLLLGDLCVSYDRLTNLRLAEADTTGAIRENANHVQLTERLFHAHPNDPDSRRGALIALAKGATLQAMRGQRDSALATYLRAEGLALEAVAAMPNNTDASRDLSICYGMRGMFLVEGGDVDSGLTVYGLGMEVSEELAAKDPENVLQQRDVADGHYEIGSMLMQAHRYEAAERRFGEAFERYSRLAARDTGNVETRTYIARSSRMAGEACQEQWRRARSGEERSRVGERAVSWLTRSMALYSRLERAGTLVGEEAAAPKELEKKLADKRSGS